ncbi:unnamed protein product [Paramecium octaurelia]|uniref:EGF-like domain-containing protein n=1 Tax=Paramecium octaurelia TaxID=43137 RepID=A0A8S1TJY5_PAROT|nr:unnamed protein product [Paramecium octaurelia]
MSWLIKLLLISQAIGINDQSDYQYIFGIGTNICPDLHVFMPDMHPHQCVSYASVCKDVTEVKIVTVTNSTQYVCHPRFQPWGAGTPTISGNIIHCGYAYGISLVLEKQIDGHYKYYCKDFTTYTDDYKRCLIFAKYPSLGIYRCQICKRPFYGYLCGEVEKFYDQHTTDPPLMCPDQCLECSLSNNSLKCNVCSPGFAKTSSDDFACQLNCQGHTSCKLSQTKDMIYSEECIVGYKKSFSYCVGPYPPCAIPIQSEIYCGKCFEGFYLVQDFLDKSDFVRCQSFDWHCSPTQQTVEKKLVNGNQQKFRAVCQLCDPGFIPNVDDINFFASCNNVRFSVSQCSLLDLQEKNCIACFQGYALQADGTCIQMQCDSLCSTCLDTNPSYCTTCDVSENKIADNGICLCLTGFGKQQDNCLACTEGYCESCDRKDFYSCNSCKSGKNRILVNKECVCLTGYYDPGNEDQVCLRKFPVIQLVLIVLAEQTKIVLNVQIKAFRIELELRILVLVNLDIQILQFKNLNAEVLPKFNLECHPKCQACFQPADETTNQYCLTCIPGQNRVVSETFQCECEVNAGDLNGTLDVCIICHYTCGNCNGTGHTDCVSCSVSSNRELTTSNECLCKQSYYDDDTENIDCQKCYYTCVTCAKSTEKDACVECPLTRKPSVSGSQFECICDSQNYFDDGFSLLCQQCDINCLTCNGPLSSNCLTCDTNYRLLDLSSCICPQGHYDIGQLECAKCHYSCQLCFDNTLDGCIACSFESNFRILKGNNCKCIDGYYEEDGKAQCKKCSYKCEMCQTGAEKCLSCPLNSLRVIDPVKGCYCPGEYYEKENEVICQVCHFKCKSCNGKSQNNCLSCDSVAFRELKGNECPCQPHYFEMEVQECTSCSALCYECDGNFENCTSCNDDRYLLGNTCKCTTKLNGGIISTFEYNGMIKCQKCHYSCGTCGGIEEGNCITCMDTEQRLQEGNTCVCKEGYFDAGLPACQKCSYQCQGCLKQSERCTSCPDNSFREYIPGFNKCQCIQKYYDDGLSEVCKKCHYSCLRCTEFETKCEICSSEQNRIYNDLFFTCDCNVGYYDIGIEKCQDCHYSCLSCNSGDANSCTSCVQLSDSNRVFYHNTCKCLFGYFDDGKSTQCQQCDIQCLSCAQQSYLCLSCPETRRIETNCKCELGYYDIGLQICSKCNSNCLTCETSSTRCTSCSSNQFRELNLVTFICDCSQGYIEINGICEQCHHSCTTCSQTINKCSSCVQYRKLINNNCICNDGMFESNVDQLCKLCDKTCLTCTNSNQNCLTCSIENFRQFKSGNICECIQGYFENPITLNCEQCSSSCLTCTLLRDNCQSCNSIHNLALVNGKCVCAQSYYFDSLTSSCLQCNITCLECQQSDECTECRLTTRHYSGDQKKCLCNDGYYETNQQHCQSCHFTCNTCENVNTNCLTCLSEYNRILANNNCLCLDGYYDAGIEMCLKCNTLCKTCQTSAFSCLSCYEIEHVRYYSGHQCICKSGYYEQNTEICLKCSNECLTCQGSANYCTSCDTNQNRIDQSIIHKCPCITGFYEDQNQNCQKCHIKCQSCVNESDQCLSCKIQLNSKRLALSQQCNCQEGYFDDGTQLKCQPCSFKCKTCQIEENNCQLCSLIIRINPPTCNCMDGYYEDEQFMCLSCASQCSTCIIEADNCLSCNQGRIGKDCSCIDGYFEIGQLLCAQCAFQCATCQFDPINCQTCKGDRFLEPQCICQLGYFDDQINENCQKCDMTCRECNIIGCITCSGNRILNEDMDCLPPPSSISYDTTPWCSNCEVAVINSYLSDDLSNIIIHFDFPLNPQNFISQFNVNKCLQIFEIEFVKKLGQNSVCYLNPDNNQELLIQLGENQQIEVGETILFKSNALSHIHCDTTLQLYILTSLEMPINPLPPQIQYNVPLHKLNPLADNLVQIKSIKNNGNRKLNSIIWSCQVKAADESPTLNQDLDVLNFAQEYNLQLPKFTLPKDSEITFKIQFENFIHITSYSEFTIQTHSGTFPQINVNVKPSYFVYQTIQIDVSAESLDSSKENPKFQIQINEIDKNPQDSNPSLMNVSLQSNSKEIIHQTIPKYTLSPNSTYTFLVTATNLITNQLQSENFTVNIPLAGFTCQFNNLGMQSIRKDLNLEIKCKDLDTTFDWNNDPNLSILVDCKDIQMNSTCQTYQKQAINVNQTAPNQIIRKNLISAFTVQEWTVTATKFSQTQVFSQIIIYIDDNFPNLDIEFNQGYLMRKINNYELLNFTFIIPFAQKPHLLDLEIAIIYNYEIIEILQPKYISHQFKVFNSIKELQFGDQINIKFSAQYTDNIMPSLNNIKLFLNQPPQCSKLLITNSNNQALSDMVVISSCDQSDDAPYKYQLKLFLRDSDLTLFLEGQSDNSLVLYPFQTLNQFQLQTPSSIDFSKIGILVQVLDNGGSMTQIFEQIAVNPAKINCTSIQFKNMNLQQKISLLFEAMNQNCTELHSQIYLNLQQQPISDDQNENILKFQTLKLYKQSLTSSKTSITSNTSTNERCIDINSTHLFAIQNSNEQEVNLTSKIEGLKENIQNFNKNLKYLRGAKQQFQDLLELNKYTWNEQVFQQYQNSVDCLRGLIYYIDDIYSNFSLINTKNEILYQAIAELLHFIPLIAKDTQNGIMVNKDPVAINGNEITFQIKRRSKSSFNKQFNLEPSIEDFLLDYVQFESLQLQTNPLRFSPDLQELLKIQFNDSKLEIYSQNYYLTQLQNVYNSKFTPYENFSSKYATKFLSYQICLNTTQFIVESEIQCALRTTAGLFYQCHLSRIQNNDSIQLTCECNKFGEIFLLASTNFVIANESVNIQPQNGSPTAPTSENILGLQICMGSLSLISMSIYAVQKYKDYKEEQKVQDSKKIISNPQIDFNLNTLTYQGNFKVFKDKFKQIHQTISLFCYKDQNIQLSYRILDVFSQLNLLLTLAILEFTMLDIQITFFCIFITLNPILVLIMRMIYKIIEAIYRFQRIAAFISQFLLIALLMTPNLITQVLTIMKYVIQNIRIPFLLEQYKIAIIFVGNLIVSQVFLEPLVIFGRIFIYRLIAGSLKKMELNPMFHLMHFFVMHSSLEELFEDFTRI